MKLPQLDHPERYGGLYAFDFGEWAAVGYTAEEIALLLESEQYQGGRVYRIHRAAPDGSLELQGVSRERFQFESCMAFHRAGAASARADFDALLSAAERDNLPCRAVAYLSASESHDGVQTHSTTLIFPAEYEPEIAAWLTRVGFEGGDTAEGGISHATGFYEQEKTIQEKRQLWSRSSQSSRSRQEVYASVRRAVQR